MEKKLIRVLTKVTVYQVNVWEVPQTEYQRIGQKDQDGNEKYAYVEHPSKTSKEETAELLYEQKFDDGDLDVRELALHLNRVK